MSMIRDAYDYVMVHDIHQLHLDAEIERDRLFKQQSNPSKTQEFNHQMKNDLYWVVNLWQECATGYARLFVLGPARLIGFGARTAVDHLNKNLSPR